MAAPADDLYPPRPRDVPAGLTAATPAHRRHAWLALGGLLTFVATYLAFTGWFGWLTYRLISNALVAGGDGVLGWILAVPSAFFFVFLVKGLFRVRHESDPTRIEVDEQSEPKLVAFVRRVAEEAGAPKPNRIYLSPRVNAAVFYDLSVLDLLLPRKKNLEIGLGLVNTLTLDEMKAVVAHEFGHFAQRTMAIGRWVYVAQQVVGHVVVARDGFDRFLEGLSRIDIRLAWIGWIMRLIVWAIRAVLDTAFRGLVVLESALSREMELQADLVSVSISGSDSLIHALHRLQSADDAWDSAAMFASSQLRNNEAITDFFSIQTHIEKRNAEIRDDDSGLSAPAIPASAPADHRVFRAKLAQPPKMWSTHPPNHEREVNAKKRYVASPLDRRSAWSLLRDPKQTRLDATERLLAQAEDVQIDVRLSDDEAIARLDDGFDRVCFERRYQGAYLGRSITRSAKSAPELYDRVTEPGDIVARLDALYPPSLRKDLEVAAELDEQHAMLVALQDGILETPGGIIRFRGEEYKRRHLTGLLETVRKERDNARDAVVAHDRRVRTAHRLAARTLSEDWETYVMNLAALLHYSEHSEADLEDSFDLLLQVIKIVMADGRVTDAELDRVLTTALETHRIVEKIHSDHQNVKLPSALCDVLEIEGYAEMLPHPFDLPQPSRENIGSGYFEALDSWVRALIGVLGTLRRVTLEALVRTERDIADAVRSNTELGSAPAPGEVPRRYMSLLIGAERQRQKKLGWWDSFVVADGWLPGFARLVAALGVLSLGVFATSLSGKTEAVIHNGLGVPVMVHVGDEKVPLRRHGHHTVDVSGTVQIHTTTLDGQEIESFEAEVDNAWAKYVYNVAGASVLVEWTAVYGNVGARPERPLGTARWFVSSADYHFTDPPRSVSTQRSSGDTRTVVSAMDQVPAEAQLAMVPNDEDKRRLVELHLTHDPVDQPAYAWWARAAGDSPEAHAILDRRAANGTIEIKRTILVTAAAARKKAICATYTADAERRPDDPDARYLAIRCLPDGTDQTARFIAAYERHPGHAWLSFAARNAYQEIGDLDRSLKAATTAVTALPHTSPYSALELVRIKRAIANDTAVDWADHAAALGKAADVLRLEHSPVDGGQPKDPLAELARGRITPAWKDAKDDRTLAVLIAASDGATEEMVKTALTIDPARLSHTALVFQLTLARREQADTAAIENAFRGVDEFAAARFIAHLDPESLRSNPNGTMAKLVDQISLAWQGTAYAAGVVMLGKQSPTMWRSRAKVLLFLYERPYFEAE